MFAGKGIKDEMGYSGSINETFYEIWYYLYNLKKVKNTHGGVILLVKLQAEVCNFTLHGGFSCFENCKNGTKSRKASQILLVAK